MKKIRYKQFLMFLGFAVTVSLFFIVICEFAINKNQKDIKTITETATTNTLNNELNVKYLIENDQVIAEELLDQRERIEIIEAQLGITEAGSYDSFGE